MDVIQTIESAAGAAVEAVEHPFHTIGHRLTAIGQHVASLMGHPYGAPPMVDALTTLHSVLIDLHQEVAELRTPCPCKPASTAAAGVIAQEHASGHAPDVPQIGGNDSWLKLTPAAVVDFKAWQKAKADAESFTSQGV